MKKILIGIFTFIMIFGVAGFTNAFTMAPNMVTDQSDGFYGQFIIRLENDGTVDMLKVNASTGVAEMFDENIVTSVIEMGDVALNSTTGHTYFAVLRSSGGTDYLEVIKYHLNAKTVVTLSVDSQTAGQNYMFDMAASNNNSDKLMAYTDNAGNINYYDAIADKSTDTGYDVTWDTDVNSIAAYGYTDRIAIAYETDAGATYAIKEAVYNTNTDTGIGDYTVKTFGTATGDVNDLDAVQKNTTQDVVDFAANYTDNGTANVIDYFVLDTPASATTYNLITSGNTGATLDATKNTSNTNIELGYNDISSGNQALHKTFNDAGVQQGSTVTMNSDMVLNYVSKDRYDNTSFALVDNSGDGYTYSTSFGLKDFEQQGDSVPELPANNLWKVLIAVLSLGLVVGIATFMKKKKKK